MSKPPVVRHFGLLLMHPAGSDPTGQVKLEPLQQAIFPEEQIGMQPLELEEEELLDEMQVNGLPVQSRLELVILQQSGIFPGQEGVVLFSLSGSQFGKVSIGQLIIPCKHSAPLDEELLLEDELELEEELEEIQLNNAGS